MARRTNRRQFLQQSALAGAGFWVAGGLAPVISQSPNERLGIVGIGVGGKGSSDIDQAAQLGNIIAICDIDDNRLQAKANAKTGNGETPFARARKYHDFRRMLEENEKQIDAVVISTPDHTHAVAAAMAMKMRKHVYVQKPLTHSVYEARYLRELAAKMKVCSQMGNQGTAGNNLREAVEIVQAGGIGRVTEVHIWTNRPVWNQSPDITSRPADSPPVPKHVHWDLFLGPAPERPYSGVYHPFSWRGWWDFGTGALGDMACHTANLPFMALRLGYPTSIQAECEPINPETYPAWAKVTFEFPARGDMAPLKLVWYEGRKNADKGRKGGTRVLPPEDLQKRFLVGANEQISGSGSVMVGDKGLAYSPDDYGGTVRFLPSKPTPPAPTLPRNGRSDIGMKEEWVRAIRDNRPQIALSNFDYAAMLTETILLGNVAMRVQGQKLMWDGPALRFPNNADANRFLQREYRRGWTL